MVRLGLLDRAARRRGAARSARGAGAPGTGHAGMWKMPGRGRACDQGAPVTRLLVFCVALLAVEGRAAEVRLLLSIGNDIGDPTDEPLEHAERDAERVAALFIDIGQVAPPR